MQDRHVWTQFVLWPLVKPEMNIVFQPVLQAIALFVACSFLRKRSNM